MASTRSGNMKLARRKFLRLVVVAAAASATPCIVRAQSYPTRPVRVIVGFPPGGGADIAARLLSQWLSERLGEPFVIENRPGAASEIGTEAAARASPDGYTLLLVTSANLVNASLYQDANFNFLRDIAPVASVIRGAFAMVVSPSFPAQTVPQFIAYAKANPGKINMAAAGAGTRVAGELFKMITGTDMTAVQYRGGAPAMTDVMSGQVQVFFSPLPEPAEFIKTGKLHALAVTSTTRSAVFPATPTLAEFVPGYEASTFTGIGAPRNTPGEIIDTLNRAINAGLADPNLRSRFTDLATEVFPGTPADCGKFFAAETEKWAKVVKFAGLKPE